MKLGKTCEVLVIGTALVSGANLALTIRQMNLTKERAELYATVRLTTDTRLMRIESKLDTLDADLETHQQMMDDLVELRNQVRALRAGSK